VRTALSSGWAVVGVFAAAALVGCSYSSAGELGNLPLLSGPGGGGGAVDAGHVYVPDASGAGPLYEGGALDASKIPGDGLDGGTVDAGPVGPPHGTGAMTAAQCGTCHTTIYNQWKSSMHAHALLSPTVIAQTNQDVLNPLKGTANPDPLKYCVNCHGPNVASQTPGPNLPPTLADGGEVPNWQDGVTCTDCHQFNGAPSKGNGGFAQANASATGYQTGFVAADIVLGELDAAVATPAHTSQAGTDFANPNKLCSNCHEVWIDYNKDNIVEKGAELALQTTWDEYTEYKTLGGTETCVSCHMTVDPSVTSIADGDPTPAPPRQLHDHTFIGVDTDLADPTTQAPTLQARTALLQSAVTFFIDPTSINTDGDNGGLTFNLVAANTGAGHNVPSGFAFARQMWIQLEVSNLVGIPVFVSGELANTHTDDLCDPDSLNEFGNPMPLFFQNSTDPLCLVQDFELTTFQQKLVNLAVAALDATDPFDPAGLTKAVQVGNETWLQFLLGGVVARTRDDFNGQVVATLKPAVGVAGLAAFTQTFQYSVSQDLLDQLNGGSASGLSIQASLMFRPLPPYFVRALGSQQPATETQVTPLISNLDAIQMATSTFLVL
jgi:hypothetical protein